jgi:signal-transduction protein with cAMP-binding, CBS, and nucleotidyltransferase domain
VLDNERLVGIFTERDVLTRVVGQRATTGTLVEQVMTKNPITVVRSTSIADAMRTMSVKRCRHLPVMFDGNVVNVVSAGDVMRHTIRYLESEVENLLSYVQNGGVTSHLF